MKNHEDDIAAIVALAEERGLTHFQPAIIDATGRVIGKRYNVRNLKKVMTDGLPIIEAIVSAVDPAGGVIETNPYFDPARGYADAIAVMDASSVRDNPFAANGQGLLLLGQFADGMSAVCPRALLDRELGRLGDLGYSLYGGFELECAPLAETRESIRSKTPDSITPMAGFDRVYSFVEESGQEDFFAAIQAAATAMDVELDSIHSEFIDMMEVGLRPQTGLRIADNAAIYKSLAKIVGKQHGALVSFMAKRDNSGQGCGAHINVSLRDSAGEGTFFDSASDDNMSETFRYFLGGLTRYMPELFLLVAPNLNSYRRYVPEMFTPLNNSWGINNKTVAFRAININPGAARIEVRVAGADVNPHLGLLATVVAGRLGLEQKLEPPAGVVGNGWSIEEDPNPFPSTFAEAIQKLRDSTVAREALGDRFVDEFADDRQWQLDQFNNTVTDWELRMFADC